MRIRTRKRSKPLTVPEDLHGTKGIGFEDYSILSIADSAGRVLFVNDRYCQVTGYSREEVIGYTHPLFLSDEAPQTVEELMTAIEQDEPWKGVAHSRSKSGLNCWLATSVVPVWDKQRQERQFLCSQHNITPAIERECRKLMEEGQKDTERLLGAVIHEVGNPLTTVKGFLQQFNSSIMFRQNQVELLLSEVKQIELTIQKLLEWTRVHQNRNFQMNRIGAIIQEAIGQCKQSSGSLEAVRFLVDAPDNLAICCIEEQIRGLLQCLIDETIRLIGRNGIIRVEVFELEERHMCVRIAGEKGSVPMTEEVIRNPAEVFVQDWTKIIRNQIVAHHGAELRRSILDGGRMELYFPLPDESRTDPV